MTRTGQRALFLPHGISFNIVDSGMILLGQSAGGLNSNADNVQSPTARSPFRHFFFIP
jgi:hypothetical protein